MKLILVLCIVCRPVQWIIHKIGHSVECWTHTIGIFEEICRLPPPPPPHTHQKILKLEPNVVASQVPQSRQELDIISFLANFLLGGGVTIF